jgi:hypothetical protein
VSPLPAGVSFGGSLLLTSAFVFSPCCRRFTVRSAPASGPQNAAPLYASTISAYAPYVLLIGYLLVSREDATVLSLGLYVFAIGFPFHFGWRTGGAVRTPIVQPA